MEVSNLLCSSGNENRDPAFTDFPVVQLLMKYSYNNFPYHSLQKGGDYSTKHIKSLNMKSSPTSKVKKVSYCQFLECFTLFLDLAFWKKSVIPFLLSVEEFGTKSVHHCFEVNTQKLLVSKAYVLNIFVV